jgi:hypothetical protein
MGTQRSIRQTGRRQAAKIRSFGRYTMSNTRPTLGTPKMRKAVAAQIRGLRAKGYKSEVGIFGGRVFTKKVGKNSIVATPRTKGVGITRSRTSPKYGTFHMAAVGLGGRRTAKQRNASRLNLRKARTSRRGRKR